MAKAIYTSSTEYCYCYSMASCDALNLDPICSLHCSPSCKIAARGSRCCPAVTAYWNPETTFSGDACMSEVGVSSMKCTHMEVDLGWAQGDRDSKAIYLADIETTHEEEDVLGKDTYRDTRQNMEPKAHVTATMWKVHYLWQYLLGTNCLYNCCRVCFFFNSIPPI